MMACTSIGNLTSIFYVDKIPFSVCLIFYNMIYKYASSTILLIDACHKLIEAECCMYASVN